MSTIDTSVLEEGLEAKEAEVVEPFDEEQLLTDLNESMVLVKRARVLLDFIADPELCPKILKRDRASIAKLSGNIREFEDVVTSNYGEVGVAYDVSVQS